MTEKPILFSGPMVRAILDGRKTQTRRVLKSVGDLDRVFQMGDGSWHVTDSQGGHMSPVTIPYAVGDRLWVREAWRADPTHDRTKPSDLDANTVRISYEADGMRFESGKLRPSIFIPRWASRITLEVTAVKVERLNEITDNDALAEGVDGAVPATPGIDIDIDGDFWPGGPVRMFLRLWESINGPGSWDRNDWVAAYTFRRVTE